MHAKVPSWEPKCALKCPLGWQNTLKCPLGWLKHDKLHSCEPKRMLKCPSFRPCPSKSTPLRTWNITKTSRNGEQKRCVTQQTSNIHQESERVSGKWWWNSIRKNELKDGGETNSSITWTSRETICISNTQSDNHQLDTTHRVTSPALNPQPRAPSNQTSVSRITETFSIERLIAAARVRLSTEMRIDGRNKKKRCIYLFFTLYLLPRQMKPLLLSLDEIWDIT